MTMGSDSEIKVASQNGIVYDGDAENQPPTKFEKIFSAFLYAISSFFVIFVNKWVLSTYNFPSFLFLAAVQFLSTSLVLGLLSLMNKIEIPPLSRGIFFEVLPITAMFLGNVLSGLGSTQALNLPMFTALRRFSILFTMLGEMFVLGKDVPSLVQYSVFAMVGGAVIAAVYDLAFDLYGYIMIFLNDLFTALNGIYMKKASLSGQCSKMGVLYYNSLFSFVAMLLMFGGEIYETLGFYGIFSLRNSVGENNLNSLSVEETLELEMQSPVLLQVVHYPGWGDWKFCVLFVLAGLMGSFLNYATFLCTTTNSALTTTVIGCLKNVLTTYLGMMFMPGYYFTWINFFGLNVSIVGSLYYTYVTMVKGLPGFGS